MKKFFQTERISSFNGEIAEYEASYQLDDTIVETLMIEKGKFETVLYEKDDRKVVDTYKDFTSAKLGHDKYSNWLKNLVIDKRLKSRKHTKIIIEKGKPKLKQLKGR